MSVSFFLFGLTSLVQATTTVPSQYPSANVYDHKLLGENSIASISGIYVNGKLIPLLTEEDTHEFFRDQSAYIEKNKQKQTEK